MIIIGGGVAGLSAGLWCDELGLNALLLEAEGEFGGQLTWTHNPIENYLGLTAGNGRELLAAMLPQITHRRFTKFFQANVKELDVEKKVVSLSDGRTFLAKAIVIATGIRRRKLGVDGETEFQNKGFLKSGKLERENVRGKKVLIVGGGDAAIENALILSETAQKVFVVHRGKALRARKEFVELLQQRSNIEVLFERSVKRICGSEFMESVDILNSKSNKITNLPVRAILLRIGVEPNTGLVSGKINLDQNGYILVNSRCETNIQGIYAVGDVSNPMSPTISSAAGSGATAIKSIWSLLNA